MFPSFHQPPPQHFWLPYSFSKVSLPTLWLLVGRVSEIQSSLHDIMAFSFLSSLLLWAVAEVYSLPALCFFFPLQMLIKLSLCFHLNPLINETKNSPRTSSFSCITSIHKFHVASDHLVREIALSVCCVTFLGGT